MSKLPFLAVLTAAQLLLSAQPAPRRVGQTNISVPVPIDPHELVVDGAHTPTSANERGMALAWMQQVIENAKFHQPKGPGYRMDIAFTATGVESGPGNMTEVWLSGSAWRWDGSVGAVSVTRGATAQGTYANSHAPVPMSIQIARNAIFAPTYQISLAGELRVAAVQWNGKPATCVLSSGVVQPPTAARLWEETEYCFDNASGLLQIASFAPGTYTVYGYGKGINFHGRSLPDSMTVFEGGKQVLAGTFQISDAGAEALSSLGPTPDMTDREAVLQLPSRQPVQVPNPQVSKVQPVIVHANVVNGQVVNAVAIAAASPDLSSMAEEFVKGLNFGAAGGQQQIYFNVKFIPSAGVNR